MKGKKLISTLLVFALMIATLAGCGGSKKDDAAGTTPAANSSTETKSDAGSAATADTASSDKELLTLEIYDVAANYQGVQTGWFAKVVKDKFNIELNIIAPQVAGDAVYQLRASSGNLGDIVILEATQFSDCLEAGLIKDISDKLPSCSNIMTYKKQVDTFNQGLNNNADGKYYGIPCQMTDTSPLTFSGETIYSLPQLRWDLYNQVGKPEIKDLDGLIEVLKQIHEVHPTNESGDPAYPFSLWPDWDGGDGMIGIANVVQLTTWYGEKIKGSAILKPDNTFIKLTDKAGSYYKILKFLNKAKREGIVDPDSGTQDWNSVCAKISAGQVDFIWYNWEVGFWNSGDRLADGTAFWYVPVKDQIYYTDSDTYYGSGRVWGVGSQVDGEKYDRIMEFLDWYASPEGLEYQHDGLYGFTYQDYGNGKYEQINDNALMDNLDVPAEFGGGGYQDGNNNINQWICDAVCTNPKTGESYNAQYWESYKIKNLTEPKKAWQAHIGAENATDYMVKNNVLVVSPSVSVNLPSDTPDISVIRNGVNQSVCDYSWKAIFAKDDAEFDAIWDQMVAEVEGFGFDDLYAFDTAKHQIEVDAKIAAQK